MNTFENNQLGRWIVIHLFKGEDVLECIAAECRR